MLTTGQLFLRHNGNGENIGREVKSGANGGGGFYGSKRGEQVFNFGSHFVFREIHCSPQARVTCELKAMYYAGPRRQDAI